MNRFLPLFFIAIIIAGCQAAASPPNNPLQIEQLSEASTQIVLTQSAKEAATQNVLDLAANGTPTSTPTPIIADTANGVFRDDFNATLEPGWTWTNENPANWSLSEVPGALRINVLGGFLYLHNISNALTRPAPTGNYFIETALTFDPDENNQFAGLVLYESDSDYIQAGIAYCNPGLWCLGRGLYIDKYENGGTVLPHIAVKLTQTTLAMRMVHSDGKFSFYTSPDGRVWYRTYEFTMDIDVKRVGLVTGQSFITTPKPAIFEYFEIGIPE